MSTLISLLKWMDQQSRQVRIEASLVEVISQVALELGVKWSFQANDSLRAPGSARKDLTVSPMSMDEEGIFSLSDST